MSSFKDIVNEDYEIQFIPSGSWVPNNNPIKIERKSSKNLTGNNLDKQTLLTIIRILQNNCILADYSHMFGQGKIECTSEKVFCENENPMRYQDQGECNGEFKHIKNNSIMKCNCILRISDSGQQEVSAK